ncbi:hypothetical protein [Salinisphaera orenii]|uniref:hypothetical protein n=1 Tax=Salinisphaera orenii TaxID=856731 RepID=UPI000F4B8408|nr:hypothetical protein [Salinisphaera orenii]
MQKSPCPAVEKPYDTAIPAAEKKHNNLNKNGYYSGIDFAGLWVIAVPDPRIIRIGPIGNAERMRRRVDR